MYAVNCSSMFLNVFRTLLMLCSTRFFFFFFKKNDCYSFEGLAKSRFYFNSNRLKIRGITFLKYTQTQCTVWSVENYQNNYILTYTASMSINIDDRKSLNFSEINHFTIFEYFYGCLMYFNKSVWIIKNVWFLIFSCEFQTDTSKCLYRPGLKAALEN